MELAGYTDLARKLGVTTNQVYMWAQRSERNGFPSPAGIREAAHPRGGPRNAPLWDPDQVLTWHASYVPSKGGAPKGPRNGLTQWHQERRSGEAGH